MKHKKGSGSCVHLTFFPLFICFLLICLVLGFGSTAHAERSIVYLNPNIDKVGANTTYGRHQYSDDWRYWSQGASGYLNSDDEEILRNMQRYGCRVVAQAKLLVEAGLASSSTSLFNPDLYFEWTVNNNYQEKGVYEKGSPGDAVIGWAQAAGASVQRQTYDFEANGWNTVEEQAAMIMNLINQGHYVMLGCGAHYAYVGAEASRSYGTPVILDSEGGRTQAPITCYIWTTDPGNFDHIVVFSINGGDIIYPFEPQKPNVSCIPSGQTVDISWNDVRADSYYVWVTVSNTQTTVWGDNVGKLLGCHLGLSPGNYTAYITALFPNDKRATGTVSFTLSEEKAPVVTADLIGQDVFLSWTDVAAPAYHLAIGSPDGSAVYYETDVGSDRSYYLHLSADVTFRANVTAKYSDTSQKTGYVDFTTSRLQASVTGGQDSDHTVGEPVILSVNTDTYDSVNVKIIRTPTNGSTYTYWWGDVPSPDYQITLNEEGYYTCSFMIRKNGMTFDSASVSWRMTEHIWSAPVYTWNNSKTELTATRTCSHSPDHIETETVAVTSSIVSPTKTEMGYITYSSDEFTNAGFTAQVLQIGISALNDMSVLYLPSSLETVDDSAFEDVSCEAVIVPAGCKTIRNHAFRLCENLRYVKIPASTRIEDDAFDGCGDVIIDRTASE